MERAGRQGMLSHLRFHRRGQSNPTSPLPEQQPSWESAAFHEHPNSAQDVSPRPDSRPQSSNSSHLPPTLPPITRVTSADSDPNFGPRDDGIAWDVRPAPARRQHDDDSAGFIGGVALQNHRLGLQGPPRRDDTATYAGANAEPQHARLRVPPPPIHTGIPYQRPAPAPTQQGKTVSSFVTPTDLQQLSAGSAGKRPAGTRLATEPAALSIQSQAAEAPKGRRGLPFLKNPMSTLLHRRKATQSIPEPGPISSRFQPGHLESDPSIRGTRVHDFSSPKPRKPVTQPQMPTKGPTPLSESTEYVRPETLPGAATEVAPYSKRGDVSDGKRPEHPHDGPSDAEPSSSTDLAGKQTIQPRADPRRFSLDKALPREPLPQDQPDEINDSSTQTSFVTAPSAVSPQASVALPTSKPSSRTGQSRNISLSDPSRRDSTMSAVPRHMKSTSSRFSFDMIGAAKQEKLLEEKHRQRQIEKGTTDDGFAAKDRDSRFDDFDEDGFDYDAMVDDDGLEERIPGVNADAEDEYFAEEEEPGPDPDNDQENFAGFVFQRSNPQSALASPLTPDMLATPRDASGKVIGFAVTKDTTPDLGSAPSPPFLSEIPADEKADDSSYQGLGIHGEGDEDRQTNDMLHHEDIQSFQPTNISTPATNIDDIYYDEGLMDDGLLDELNFEPDGSTFDESLFDLNDTDRFGRPLPGVFAQAKSMMIQQHQDTNRLSDETSRVSGQSAFSQSTAHTSLDVGLQPVLPSMEDKADELNFQESSQRRSSVAPVPGPDLAYQAALAEAAHKAAASGKFRRGASPPPQASLPIVSPTDSSESHAHSHLEKQPDLDDDPYSRMMEDDDDFDDDAIIAEANADALANDSDGFYGQEFGFYSAPITLPQHGHGHHAASTSPKPLTDENLFQYANGGFFGPAGGVNRSASGRMVSREPNLTPITERSEYSNRNSIMSLAVLPGVGSAGGAPSSAGQMQSPGLAELAMMSDDDPNMSMSALLRLRSKAFGGSKASLHSSPEGSPRSELGQGAAAGPGDGASSPWSAGSNLGGHSGPHMRKNSMFSLGARSNSDAGSGAGSPTLTMSVPAVQQQPLSNSYQTLPPVNMLGPSPIFSGPGGQAQQSGYPSTSPVLPGLTCPPVLEEDLTDTPQREPPIQPYHNETTDATFASPSALRASPTSLTESQGPVSPSSSPQYPKRPAMGHRHKGSADSISYIKDEDSGETRWVMERRRVGDTGEVEFLEREVVEGGRI